MCQITLRGDTGPNMCRSAALRLSHSWPPLFISSRLVEGLLCMLILANSITASKMDKLAADTLQTLFVLRSEADLTSPVQVQRRQPAGNDPEKSNGRAVL